MATGVLRDKQYMYGVQSLLEAEKALLIRNDLAGMLLRQSVPQVTVNALVQMFELTWTIC